jgi:3-methyladenine DNA glycosylase AlkD
MTTATHEVPARTAGTHGTATGTTPETAAAATTSEVTLRARAFVAAHLDAATALGRAAGDLAADPAEVAAALRAGLPALADPEYLDGQRRIAPGLGPTAGVRNPLLTAITRGLRARTRRDRPSTLLDIAGRLLRDELLELHWLAFDLLDRAMTGEPERAWQLVRAEARTASDWITVDSLAHVAGRGVLAEPFRWAELEQLVYSPSRWERRLAASTVATIPFVDRVAGRRPAFAARGLGIIGDLIGDDEPDVQKALSWALRNLAGIDRDAVVAFLERETEHARAADDGHRAWVIRDSLEKIPAPIAAAMRAALTGIRRHGPSTSRAAATAADFLGLGTGVMPADRPVVARPMGAGPAGPSGPTGARTDA